MWDQSPYESNYTETFLTEYPKFSKLGIWQRAQQTFTAGL